MAVDTEFAPESGAATEPQKEVAKDVATEQESQIAGETPKTPETIPYSDFQALQSKMDKRNAELEKELRTLREKSQQELSTPKGPSPDEKRKQQDLTYQWQNLQQQLAQAEEEQDFRTAAALGRQLGGIETALMQADLTVAAREAGLDPNNPDLQAGLASGNIASPSDIQALVWRVAATSRPESQQAEALKSREAELEKREASLDQTVQETVAKELAKLRQELGLNTVPGVQPQGAATPRVQLEREYEAARQSGNMRVALRIKRQLMNTPE